MIYSYDFSGTGCPSVLNCWFIDCLSIWLFINVSIKWTAQLINSTVQSLQKTEKKRCIWSRNSPLLTIPKLYSRVKRTPLDPILSHVNPISTLKLNFCSIHIDIIIQSTCTSVTWPLVLLLTEEQLSYAYLSPSATRPSLLKLLESMPWSDWCVRLRSFY